MSERRTREPEEELDQPQRGPMSEDPQFEPVTNDGLVCADCRYRIPERGVLICHKYDMKPAEVLNGGPCPKHKKES